jgi:peptide/nickel transport system substrate-binding protein
MSLRRRITRCTLLGLLILCAWAAPAGAAQKMFRVGWAQAPQTLNPFVDQDSEDFVVWAINYDLLVGFSPKDLSPVPGIARSWDVSPDKKTVTFHLIRGAKWSDGKPITSADVKYSIDVLGGNGALFTAYTDDIASVKTPDASTVVITTKQPDARTVGGLAIYILPEHIWSRHPVKQLLGAFRPDFPMVGSGPYIVTKFQRGKIIEMRRNPHWRGTRPRFDGIQFIKYGTQDAVERALQLGEIDYVHDAQSTSFARLGRLRDIKTVASPSPSFTELAFNLCSKAHCPDAQFNPAVQDRTVRQAIAYGIDRGRINTIAARGTSFVGHGLLPQFYKSFFRVPAQDYPYDPARANRMLDAAGWKRGSDGVRTKGGEKLSFDLAVRTESAYNTQAAGLVAEMARKIGVRFNVDTMSTDRLTEITTRTKNGKPAPDFDTFIWGWGGDSYDPSTLLNLLTTKAIGNSSDSFYSNPAYDRLYTQQLSQFDPATRAQTVAKMIAIAQRDLPYLVLTVDPVLEAYRTDRVSGVQLSCPQPGGDVLCEQTSYAPWLKLGPPVATAASTADGGGSSATGIVVAIVVVALLVVATLVVRARRRRAAAEPLEVDGG